MGYYIKNSYFILLSVCLLLLLLSCTMEEPVAPRWNTKWSIPLIDKTYAIADIFDELDEENLIIDEDSIPRFEVNETIDTFYVGDHLTSSPTSNDYTIHLGTIDISPPPAQTAQVMLDDLVPSGGGFVPESDFNYVYPPLHYDDFQWITVQSGWLYVSLYNQLSIQLDSISMEIENVSDSRLIGELNFPGGAMVYETVSDSIDLSDKTIGNQLIVRISGHTPGGDLDNPEPYYLELIASFSDPISINSGSVRLPQITKEFDLVFQSADSSVISEAIVSYGNISGSVGNYMNSELILAMEIPNIVYEQDEFRFNKELGVNENELFDYDLAGYMVYPDGDYVPQSFQVELDLTIPSSGEQYVLIDELDSLRIISELSEFRFSEMNGRIKPIEIEVTPTSRTIDIPRGLRQARLTRAYLYLDYFNYCQFDAQLDLMLYGSYGAARPPIQIPDRSLYRVQDDVKTLEIDELIDGKGADSPDPQQTTIIIEPPELYEFLDPPPAFLDLFGTATFNPNAKSGKISQLDLVFGNFTITSILAFSLKDTANFDLDIEAQDISEDVPDFEDRVKYVSVNADIANRLPVGVEVTLYLSSVKSDSSIYYDDSTVIIGPLFVSPSSV
ncbi:MAG: hypothetical protein GF315_03650, partial [candidate division Zixibacteria bacterium]|nr:hypothetical protein [candidate division Zixibacteria bacterium]